MHSNLFHISEETGMDGCVWMMLDDIHLNLSYLTGYFFFILQFTLWVVINKYIAPKEGLAPWVHA